MAQGDNKNTMISGSNAVLGTAVTALNTAIATLRADATTVYAGKITIIQSGLFSNYDNTGAATGYIAWAQVQYLSAT